MPGFAPAGTTPLATLPAGLSLATPDPLRALLAKPHLPRTYLIEAQPLNSLGAVVTVRLSDDGYRTPANDPTLPATPYKGRLMAPHNMTARVMDSGRLLRRSLPAYGDIEVINNDGRLDDLADLVFAGRPIVTKVGSPGFRYDEFGIIRSGVCEDPTWDEDRISLPARDPQQRMAKPIQTRFYRGTNGCARFDGLNDFGTLGSYAATATAVFEVSFRCVGNNTAGDAQVLAAHGPAWATSSLDWNVQIDAAGILSAHITRGSASDVALTHAGRDYRDGQWHQLTLVITAGANACVLYVDGAQIATGTAPTFTAVTGNLNIASRPGGAAGFFRGDIDEVRLWKVTRTAAEIRAAMVGELANPSASTLTAYHRLNDTSGTTATATIGSNGTVSGAIWVSSLEGGAELAGKPKPLGFGQVRNFEPVLVDALRLIYQVHDGGYQAIDTALDMGDAITAAGDTSDIQGATVLDGQYKTNLSAGYIRLGRKPLGKFTVDFRGDTTGGYVFTAAGILRRVVQRYGALLDADLDLGSFSALDVANAAVHGLATRLEPVNIDELCDRLAGSPGAWWTYTRAGLLQLRQLTDPAAATPVGTITSAQIRDKGLRRLASVPPSKGQRLGYRRNAVTLQPNEVATSVSADLRAQLAEELRYAVVDDTSVLTLYRDAVTWSDETLMDDPAAAQAEAARRQALYGVRRAVWQVDLRDALHVYWLGDVVTLTYPRWGLQAGKRFVVVAVTEDSAQRATTLELWG